MTFLRIRPGITANKLVLTPTGPRLVKLVGVPSASGSATGSSNIASKLVIFTAPANAVSGSIFGTQPVIQMQTSSSVIVTDATASVVAYLKSGSGILGGTKVVNTVSGSATFTNLSYTGSGNFVIGFSAILPYVHQIFEDNVESDKTSQYFEVETASGRFGRAADPSYDTAWKSVYQSGTQVNHGSLHLAFGKTPSSYFASVFSSSLDFADVTAEFDIRHSIANPWTDKLFRFIVFSATDYSQAAIGHAWAETSTQLKLDPATGTNASGTVITSGYNDFANLTFLGLQTGTAGVFGSTATTRKRIKVRMRLDDPYQNNGVLQSYVDGVLDAQSTGAPFVKSYTDYGINAAYFEAFTNTPQVQTYDRYFDNISVYGRIRSVVSASMTVTTGSGEPQPSDAGITILRDFRAGGAQDLQAVTTTAQMYALFQDDSGNGQTNPVLSLDVDGAGTNAVRCDWTAGGDTDPEQNCYVESQFTPFNDKPLYVWCKVRLGRTATGGGNGSVGAFALNANHANAHIKKFLIQRVDNTYRIYSKLYPSSQDWQIDQTNLNTADCSDSLMNHIGVTQTVTIKYTLPNRIEMWLNGTKVWDGSDDIGSTGFKAVQWMATMLVPNVDMSEYLWDMVIGRDT